jgi:hypothetical protein
MLYFLEKVSRRNCMGAKVAQKIINAIPPQKIFIERAILFSL